MDISYVKSASCCLQIVETANLTISVRALQTFGLVDRQSVIWALWPLRDYPWEITPTTIMGNNLPPDVPMSMAPLRLGESEISVPGFSMASRGGPGPSHSGFLSINLYLWATQDVSEIILTTKDYVDVKFNFWGLSAEPVKTSGTRFVWYAKS
jgi:hypothetical protein